MSDAIKQAVALLPELKIRLAVKHDPAWLETRVISDKHLKIIIAALESLAATGAGGDGEMVERVARAIAVSRSIDLDAAKKTHGFPNHLWNQVHQDARAALTAINGGK